MTVLISLAVVRLLSPLQTHASVIIACKGFAAQIHRAICYRQDEQPIRAIRKKRGASKSSVRSREFRSRLTSDE